MVTDSLAFLGKSFNGPAADVTSLLDAMDGLRIEQVVVCPFKPPGYDLLRANETVAEAVRSYPDRLIGLARVDPWQGGEGAMAEVDRCVEELGLRGIFLHPWEETFNISGPQVDPIAVAAGRHQIPVVVAAGYPFLSEALQVGDLASRHPGVTFIATNGCQINISGLATYDVHFALKRNPNLFIQTAGVYRQDFLSEVIDEHGVERLLFASGFPLTDPRLEILRVSGELFDEATQDAICYENAQRLFPRPS